MFQTFFNILLFFGATTVLLAQPNGGSIQVNRNDQVNQLVRDVFIKRDCKNVSNVTGSGEPVSFGQFKNAGNIIGFPEGIILSTGDVELAEGPNESVETTDRFNNVSNDKDLAKIATNRLFDVTVLEFDFVPLSSQVSFQYVFASEEYCEFVGTIFNDVFGFFVSGPGINGEFDNDAINVARLPDSDEFVSINSVNHLFNSNNYVKNELEGDANNCQVAFNPGHLNTIEYDGFTAPLVARFEVIPCETYHIRLVVGDVGDDKLDSAVFLRSESFDLGELAKVKAIVVDRTDTTAYENCTDGGFIFTRPAGANRNEPYPIDFRIDENSTAIEGIDFQPITRSMVIPSGQNSANLPIQILDDQESENLETLTLTLDQICECEEGNQATLKIGDNLPPEITFPAIEVCVDQPFTIQPTITNGVPPFNFLWNDTNVAADSILPDTIQQSTSYQLTISDFCGNSTIDSTTVNIQNLPSATLTGEVDFCEGQPTANLPLTFNGNAPWSFAYTIDNGEPQMIDSIFDTNFQLPVNQSGLYQLIDFSDANCKGEALGTGVVKEIGFQVNTESTLPTCPKTYDGSILIELFGGQPPYIINWSTPVSNELNPTNLAAGDYEVSIIDAQNCMTARQINLPLPTSLDPSCLASEVYIPNVFSPNGDGINDFFEIFFPDKSILPQVKMVQIMDRWGNRVFATENDLPRWDGTLRGQALDPAVFQYRIILELADGRTEILQGDVSLVR
ncbi:MAG: choice-of-anchor L domain-containing protein [Bacteroidota bacterium]